MESKQTVYKNTPGYYNIWKERLLKDGYSIIEDTKEKTIFIKTINEPNKI
jgi:hypothetical protein